MRGVFANRHRTADTPNLAAQGQSVSRKTVAEVPLAGLSYSTLVEVPLIGLYFRSLCGEPFHLAVNQDTDK